MACTLHQKSSFHRPPVQHTTISTNHDTVRGSSSKSTQVAQSHGSIGKIRRTREESILQRLEHTRPPQKRRRLEKAQEYNALAEKDAVICARHWDYIRFRPSSPQPKRSLVEDKAIASWLGTYLGERFIANKALQLSASEIVTRTLYDAFDFYQPESAVIFLALMYLEQLLPQLEIDLCKYSDEDCGIIIIRAYVIAFSLAWKWLDDYDYPLQFWSKKIRLTKENLAELEILALSSLDWRLSIAPPAWTIWLIKLQRHTTTMDSPLFNWRSKERVVNLIGRSLKELLAMYSSDPFDPLPSQGETCSFASTSSRAAGTSFQQRLTVGIEVTAVNLSKRPTSLSAVPPPRKGDRADSLHRVRPSIAGLFFLPNTVANCHHAVHIQSTEVSLQNIPRSDLRVAGRDCVNSKSLEIHRWREKLYPM
ncbi:hypothetical protein L218DRAFT_1077210 [Marasmius fiardii PR-910]|nr:hypothetical protein L218DRAFT_1077210 [Marasmius fiardii PR-910]